MKKINFKSVASTLSQKEMKNVLGGSINTGCTTFECGMGTACTGAITGNSGTCGWLAGVCACQT